MVKIVLCIFLSVLCRPCLVPAIEKKRIRVFLYLGFL